MKYDMTQEERITEMEQRLDKASAALPKLKILIILIRFKNQLLSVPI